MRKVINLIKEVMNLALQLKKSESSSRLRNLGRCDLPCVGLARVAV